MYLEANIVINDKKFSFDIDVNAWPRWLCFLNGKNIKIDNMRQISVTENIVIITVGSKLDFRDITDETPLRVKNNMDAFDWKGNHLWNISDIVGPLKKQFMGGCFWTNDDYNEYATGGKRNYIDGHPLYAAITDGRGYLIDIKDRKVIHTFSSR